MEIRFDYITASLSFIPHIVIWDNILYPENNDRGT